MPNEPAEHVLIVEDTSPMAELYRTFLRRDGIESSIVDNGEDALQFLRTTVPAVMILDLNLPGIGGFEVLSGVVAESPGTAVVVVTSNGSVRTAVEAMQQGAYDFLVKPFNADRLVTTVRNALERARLREEVVTLREGLARDRFSGFVGASLAMQAVYRMIEVSAGSNVTVFITGESGTGKEVAAEALHRLSPRKGKPFVALNCGAIARDLAESELFGHRKGSFTGAIADRLGAVQQANGGTLFLDELCEMPLDLQTKLLRFLQSGEFQPVGATRTEHVDVRIICATNRNPLEEVRAGRFREDLYYRLHVVPIAMPPLRDREDDAVLIAQELLVRYAKEDGRAVQRLSPDACRLIRTYGWPGNVRQLQNVIRNVVVMNQADVLTADMLPIPREDAPASFVETQADVAADASVALLRPLARAMSPAASTDPGSWGEAHDIVPLDQVERAAIQRAIAMCGGNVPRAAALLGVNPSTLYRKKTSWDAA